MDPADIAGTKSRARSQQLKSLGRPCLLALALLLAACSGADQTAPANKPTPAPRQSRLIAFDPGAIGQGVQFAQCTSYWKLAEEGNGNTLPVLLEGNPDNVVRVQIDALGDYHLLEDGKVQPRTLTEVSVTLHRVARQSWNIELDASSAALLVAADRRAPLRPLYELCKMLVSLQVRNCWLITGDERDQALRLLPLKIDVVQLEREWYHLTSTEEAALVRLTHTPKTKSEAALTLAAGDGSLKAEAAETPGWPDSVLKTFVARAAGIKRVQFDFGPELTVSQLVQAIDALAPLGYAEVEPWYPALERQPPKAAGRVRRELAAYPNELGTPQGVDLPGLSEYWRVCADMSILPEAAALKPDLPSLGVGTLPDGTFVVRAKADADWRKLSDSNALQAELAAASGEVDFDLGLSELQVVLYMDRKAPWQSFLEVLEILRGQRCYRLSLPVWDNLGPTIRLLDLSLPLTEVPENERVASVRLERKGSVDDAAYTLRFSDGGAATVHTGSRWPAALVGEVQQRAADVRTMFVVLPRDEPFQTLCTLLNSTALLGMQSIRFGG